MMTANGEFVATDYQFQDRTPSVPPQRNAVTAACMKTDIESDLGSSII